MPRRSNWTNTASAGLIIAVGVTIGLSWWGQKAPLSVRLVDDKARLLTIEQGERVSEFHRFLLNDHDIDYRVVSDSDVDDINRFAVDRFAELSAGMRSTTGRGLLLVIASSKKLVRLEVSQSLEPVYTDAFVKYIEERQMVPFFASGRIADGILATTELIVARVQEAKTSAELDPLRNPSKSGGGGAVAKFSGNHAAVAKKGTAVAPGRTPAATLAAYLEAMDQRNGSRDLTIYTPATRAMLNKWTMTPAQMDMVVKSYRNCVAESARKQGGHAVIRYRIKDRACAPFFFQKSTEGWQLDLTMMHKAIRFGRSNAWRFDLAVAHPYEFAFEDWRFDKNGFPQAVR